MSDRYIDLSDCICTAENSLYDAIKLLEKSNSLLPYKASLGLSNSLRSIFRARDELKKIKEEKK